jgi:hypothetical protein
MQPLEGEGLSRAARPARRLPNPPRGMVYWLGKDNRPCIEIVGHNTNILCGGERRYLNRGYGAPRASETTIVRGGCLPQQ